MEHFPPRPSRVSPGCSTPPRSGPARLVLLTTLLLHVVVLAHYTSNLASSLAAGPHMPSFSTIQAVLDEPRLSFGVMRETALVEYLKVRRSGLARVAQVDALTRGDQDCDIRSLIIFIA